MKSYGVGRQVEEVRLQRKMQPTAKQQHVCGTLFVQVHQNKKKIQPQPPVLQRMPGIRRTGHRKKKKKKTSRTLSKGPMPGAAGLRAASGHHRAVLQLVSPHLDRWSLFDKIAITSKRIFGDFERFLHAGHTTHSCQRSRPFVCFQTCSWDGRVPGRWTVEAQAVEPSQWRGTRPPGATLETTPWRHVSKTWELI